jgi:hypothetical protein
MLLPLLGEDRAEVAGFGSYVCRLPSPLSNKNERVAATVTVVARQAGIMRRWSIRSCRERIASGEKDQGDPTLALPITSRMLGVDLDGTRRIEPAHVGWPVGPDGSRRIEKDRLDEHRG